MKVTTIDSADGGRKPIVLAEDLWTLTVEEFGVKVHIGKGVIGRRDVLNISVDPSGTDGAYRLDVQEVAAHSTQARLVVGSRGDDTR